MVPCGSSEDSNWRCRARDDRHRVCNISIWRCCESGAAVLCMLFALVMQIDANFVNDYFDFMKGTDDEKRLGPKRACAQGWITAAAMRRGLLYTTLLACVIGLPLVYYGGWEMILVGLPA